MPYVACVSAARRRIIAGSVALLIGVVACGSTSSSSAAGQARIACATGHPALPGATSGPNAATSTQTFGHVLADYEGAQTHSAKAEALDPRWSMLNAAYGVLVAAWSAMVAATAPDATDQTSVPTYSAEFSALTAVRSEWQAQATAAETTVRSECAVADATH
jgi:hypothetical protein